MLWEFGEPLASAVYGIADVIAAHLDRRQWVESVRPPIRKAAIRQDFGFDGRFPLVSIPIPPGSLRQNWPTCRNWLIASSARSSLLPVLAVVQPRCRDVLLSPVESIQDSQRLLRIALCGKRAKVRLRVEAGQRLRAQFCLF
ncbi:MAG: hypothetical protein KF778_21275 [Rhodocyclaceae bacterium]|nr:hypothetical protein [Rhodocyclaceae bacterium]